MSTADQRPSGQAPCHRGHVKQPPHHQWGVQTPSAYANLPPPSAPPPPREYANISVAASSAAAASPAVICPAELTDPQLNYMDMDYTTGRGVPVASCSSSSSSRTPYALLGLDGFGAVRPQPPEPRLQEALEQRLRYVELDFRAMAALAATAKAERELPTCCSRQAAHRSSASIAATSFARLRASLAKSLSRMSLSRRKSKSRLEPQDS